MSTLHDVGIEHGSDVRSGGGAVRAVCTCGWKGKPQTIFHGQRRKNTNSARDRARQQALAHVRNMSMPDDER